MAEAHRDQAQAVEATLLYIGRSLASNPDGVTLTSEAGERGARLRLEVDRADLGRLIGRAGRTARAIRGVVRAAGALSGVHVSVEIAARDAGDGSGSGEDPGVAPEAAAEAAEAEPAD